MTVIEALFLGLIQGITEFLPISSSAHLIIFRHFMKIEDTQTVFFNVLLHFGSMIAILLTFSKEWKRLFLALCGISARRRPEVKFVELTPSFVRFVTGEGVSFCSPRSS